MVMVSGDDDGDGGDDDDDDENRKLLFCWHLHFWPFLRGYPLVNVDKTIDHHPFVGKLTNFRLAHCQVRKLLVILPEANPTKIPFNHNKIPTKITINHYKSPYITINHHTSL